MDKVELLKKEIYQLEAKIDNIQCTPTCGEWGEFCCRGRRGIWREEIGSKKKEIEIIINKQ